MEMDFSQKTCQLLRAQRAHPWHLLVLNKSKEKGRSTQIAHISYPSNLDLCTEALRENCPVFVIRRLHSCGYLVHIYTQVMSPSSLFLLLFCTRGSQHREGHPTTPVSSPDIFQCIHHLREKNLVLALIDWRFIEVIHTNLSSTPASVICHLYDFAQVIWDF